MSERCCINCRHVGGEWGSDCTHPEARKSHAYYGEVNSHYSEARAFGGACGPDAALFEQQTPAQRSSGFISFLLFLACCGAILWVLLP